MIRSCRSVSGAAGTVNRLFTAKTLRFHDRQLPPNRNSPQTQTPARTPGAVSRRAFLNRAAGVFGTLAAGSAGPACRSLRDIVLPGDFDVVIRGGTVYAGDAAPIQADVGIVGERIAAIGDLSTYSARREIDARDRAVCPGFIDLHSHSDLTALGGRADSKIRQGVTTEVVGQDGRSIAPIGWSQGDAWRASLRRRGLGEGWRFFDGYADAIREYGSYTNLLSLIGTSTLRRYVSEWNARPMSAWEMREARKAFQKAQARGARYLSSGLEYLPGAYSTKGELIALARDTGIYFTHMRNEDDRVLPALQEAIEIAKRAGTHLHISHIKAQGQRNWSKLPSMLRLLDSARGWTRRVSCDRYPYLAYNNGLMTLFPIAARQGGNAAGADRLRGAAFRERMRPAVERKIASLGSWDAVMRSDVRGAYANYSGQRLGTLAGRLGRRPYDLLADIVIAHRGGGTMVGFAMSPENLRRLLRYSHCAIATDGAALNARSAGRAHPRTFGSFPRVLGQYARDEGVLSLQEAIRKMTALPADIVGLTDRGRLAVNAYADVVVFDPRRVADRATYLRADYPVGIESVLVNGAVMVSEERPLDSSARADGLPGRLLSPET